VAGHRLGVGVAGAGRRAGLAHLPGWAEGERCRIVGVCDLDLERATTAADRYEAKIVTRDYGKLLDRDDIDAVDVVTRRWVSLPLDAEG
jgi:predicted dehydrogenase